MSRAFAAAAGLLLGAAMLLAPSRVRLKPLGRRSCRRRKAERRSKTSPSKCMALRNRRSCDATSSLHEGSILEQAALNRDFDNLKRLADYRHARDG